MRLRKARFSGSWYTNDPVVLRSEIDEFMELVQKDLWRPLSQQSVPRKAQIASAVKGGILPHAGLYFSGRGIAHFFHNLGSDAEKIIIIAPSHYIPLIPDTLFCSTHDYFDTPLGRVPGTDLLAEDESREMHENNHAVEMEHAVEMFLPFIARAREVSSQPISVGIILVSEITGKKPLEHLADYLENLLGKEEISQGRTVLIASSDFTHYGPRFAYTPFGTDDIPQIEKEVETQDREIADYFCSYRLNQLFDIKQQKDVTICGFAPALLVSLLMERIGARGIVSDYYNSNSLVGPDVGFVSYCTILWR